MKGQATGDERVRFNIERKGPHEVSVIFYPGVDDGRRAGPLGRCEWPDDSVIRSIDEIASSFVSSGIVEPERQITIDLLKPPSIKRFAPETPVQFYEARMSLADLIRPLFLPPLDFELLRPFQKVGAQWLIGNKRGILADDMGLGKTAQAIFAARSLIRSGKVKQAIVVCPGILVSNWNREIARWAGELGVCFMRPSAASRSEGWRAMRGRMHILLTTYDQVRIAAHQLKAYPAELLILDEAHRLRNPQSLTSVGIRSVQSEYVWALTGTPIERDPVDLVSLLNIVAPGRIGRSIGSLGAVAVRTAARPLILRRHKQDVLAELPPSTEQNVWLDLTASQRLTYDATIKAQARHSTPLALIAHLKKICDLDPESGQSSKIDYIVDQAVQVVKAANEKIVVFSLSLAPLAACRTRLAEMGIKALLLTGKVPSAERELVLQEFRDGGPCVLLASAKLASEGLTLTEANHVYFVNLWWNPSANSQARDRVLRIGQEKRVSIKNLLCVDTIDEEIHRIVENKNYIYTSITDMLALTSLGKRLRPQAQQLNEPTVRRDG